MPGKFVVSLTAGPDNADRATVAFVVANAAVGSEKETVVFLSMEGVRLSIQGAVDHIHEDGFAKLADLIASFAREGGKIFVCSPCFKKRKLDESKLVPGAVVVGGARLVEFMDQGTPSISY